VSIVYLGLGSNMQAAKNLQTAVASLRSRFGDVALSNTYKSKALGFEGDDFLNLVARIETDLKAPAICAVLDELHAEAGRERGRAWFASRPLDVDLLLYDSLVDNNPPVRVPRSDVLEYSFVLVPLAELAPDYVHPVTGRSISDHLRDFDETTHPLTKINLNL